MSTTAAKPRSRITIKQAHDIAINCYQKWVKQNPQATRRERIAKFDNWIDMAERARKRQNDS